MPRTTVADPALDAVVPVTPRWRVVVGVVVGVGLLAGAVASASALRPGVVPGSTSGGANASSPSEPVTTIQLEGAAPWQRVVSVTGPDVAAAWLTTDDPLGDAPTSPVRTLPATLHRGERAWLVIRWSDPCGASAAVRSVGVLGTALDEPLPDAFTPAAMLDDGVSANACAGGS